MSANEPGSAEDQVALTPTAEQPSTASTPKKTSKLPIIALVVVILLVILGMVGWKLWPQWQEQLSPVLRGVEQTPSHVASSSQAPQQQQQQAYESSPRTAEVKATKQPAASPTINSDETAPSPTATVAEPAVSKPAPSTTPASSQLISAPLAVVVDSKELATAQAKVSKLQAALATMQHRNDGYEQTIDALRQSELAANQALLHSQLDWIIDHNTRLPRIAAIWQLIADNPAYSAAQQQEAAELANLATQQAATIQQWVQTLQDLLPSLQSIEHPSLLPNDQWWQRWLNAQFSIRPVADRADKERALLATDVTAILEQLQRGELPEDAQWSAMVSKLSGQGFDQASLPATLSPFIAQTARLRAVARQWQEVQS